MNQGPDPTTRHPLPGLERVVFLKNVITRPNILVGDFTYYDDPVSPDRFQDENVLYHFDFVGDRLIIGKFCAIAHKAKFVMNGGNHLVDGFSTFPFAIFGHGWAAHEPTWPDRGDLVVGNDVWIGYDALVMPGVVIGNGAIVAARSVVTKDVPPYAIVGGNPAQVIRYRFEPEVIALLQQLAWWDWPVERISAHLDTLIANDIDRLRAIADDMPGASGDT